MPFGLAIHGGAGLIRSDSLSEERRLACEKSLQRIITQGENLLAGGASAVDTVTACVVSLEDDPLFNAGRGSVYAADGSHEFDAALMCGQTSDAGAIGAVSGVKNPILLARAVMEKTQHVMLVGAAASEWAKKVGMIFEAPSYFRTEERWAQFEATRSTGRFSLDHGGDDDDVYGTVGAVACDSEGNVAAATSTGGMVNKANGRVGDSPIIGGGTYASNQSCAVSATGHGEALIRQVVASRVAHWVELGGLSLQAAVARVVHEEMTDAKAYGGLIAVAPTGHIMTAFNTGGMFRATVSEGEPAEIGIW